MEKFQELREKANVTIHRADHMLTMTYPLLKEPKILVSVANNIFISVEYILTSILEYERLFKRIPSYADNFDSKLTIFRDKIARRYGLNPEYIKLLVNMKELINAHKNSSVEFSRQNKFVIANEEYELRTLTAADLKKYISKAKLFIEDIHKITIQNDGIFN